VALVIQTSDGAQMEYEILFIRRGEPTLQHAVTTKNVVYVLADHHELDLILRQFANLPAPFHKKSVRWYGDMAQFIASNLS